ncbi:SAVMC3_10250 family protein [Streptomyces sp. NPDC004728]|uniref:SAVMC3_10250 family protein n=1 Tax=Streptomyces sp. NPDC004728 TaxID=3154289 RepID=UPI0033A58930
MPRRSKKTMRDLLYLSETKMQVLVPQLPDKSRKRLGIEAGINAGIVSVKGTLAGRESNTRSSIEALDAVVEMIEKTHGRRSRNDPDLRSGDWITINEVFQCGRPRNDGSELTGPDGLVCFAAATLPPLMLLTSAKHILEVRQGSTSAEVPSNQMHPHYLNHFLSLYRHLIRTQDGAGELEPDFATTRNRATYLMLTKCREVAEDVANGGEAMRLSGLARVLSTGPTTNMRVVATPLYLEYAPR